MVDNQFEWNKEALRVLRLRMGWSKSDLARRLQCSSQDVDSLEEGKTLIEISLKNQLELLLRQADACSDEVKYAPVAENTCDKKALEQIDFSRIKAGLE